VASVADWPDRASVNLVVNAMQATEETGGRHILISDHSTRYGDGVLRN
jgi:hypothetical protein